MGVKPSEAVCAENAEEVPSSPRAKDGAAAVRTKTRFLRACRWGVLLLAGVLLPPLRAVIFYATADPAYNTTAPGGTLSGSGWQWEGNWAEFTGTAIGPHHFISARHVGGAVGDPFVLGGTTYTTTAYYDDAATDLRIWQISGTFPTWAPLYRGTAEIGKPLVVFGRGVGRGAEVQVGGVLKGWMWSTGIGTMRWGQNTVGNVIDAGSGLGHLLQVPFNANGGPNEAHLGVGDSSGAVFIQENGVWQLAGINYAVDGLFSYTGGADEGFYAALFDMSGLYAGHTGQWTRITAHTPSAFYSTQISARIAWIDGIVPPTPVASDSSDAPLFGPYTSWVFAAALFVSGAVFLAPRSRGVRRHVRPNA